MHLTGGIRGDAAAAVQAAGFVHQIALFGERRGSGIEPGIEHRHAAVRRTWLGRSAAEPRHVDATVATECQMRAAHGAHGDGGLGLRVHP